MVLPWQEPALSYPREWEAVHVEEGNYRPRRMGGYGIAGDGADRAGAARAEAPARQAYGRHSQAARGRLSARHRQPAFGPGQMPAVSQRRPGEYLSGLRVGGYRGLGVHRPNSRAIALWGEELKAMPGYLAARRCGLSIKTATL